MSGSGDRRNFETAGRRAEWLAAMYLRLKRYRILETRFRAPSGEIDLIALKGGDLIFAEVKQRQNLVDAQDAVTYRSRKRIISASETFVARNPAMQQFGMRYDAIYVLRPWRIVHEIDAWQDF